jgi:hypothetical protein
VLPDDRVDHGTRPKKSFSPRRQRQNKRDAEEDMLLVEEIEHSQDQLFLIKG